MGAAECHEHFLLFDGDSAHATFAAPTSCDAVTMCQEAEPAPNSLTSRERLIHGVTPRTVMDFSQGMSASYCLGA